MISVRPDMPRDEAHAWVRTALIKSAQEQEAERRAKMRVAIEKRRLAAELKWVRSRLADIERHMGMVA